MEEKTVVTNLNNEKLVLDKHLLFEWKCLNRQYHGSKVEIKFQRDDSVSYFSELKKLENEYGEYKIGSMIPTIICPAISIIMFTVFLVLFLVNRENFNFLLYFLSILLPAIAIFLVGVAFMLLRYFSVKKIGEEKPKKDQEYRRKVDLLKQPTNK